jgi:hypothetical protein
LRLLLSRTDDSICVNNPGPHFTAEGTHQPTTAPSKRVPALFAERIGGFSKKTRITPVDDGVCRDLIHQSGLNSLCLKDLERREGPVSLKAFMIMCK